MCTKENHKEKEMEKQTPKEVSNAVSLMLNCFGNKNGKAFIEEMSKEHKTLQQRFTQLCFDWLSHCDSLQATKRFDGRNEASVDIANKLFDFMDSEGISFNRKYILPFI